MGPGAPTLPLIGADGVTPQNWTGLISYVEYFLSALAEVWRHLFVITGDLSGHLGWNQTVQTTSSLMPSKGQWVVYGNLPEMTNKGEQIIASIMTIVHNGIVAVAQFSTLLPYAPLTSP